MGLDSIELVVEVEKYFSISIPDREAEKSGTVGKLVDCVSRMKGIDKYDFSLREKTFFDIRNQLSIINNQHYEFKITDKINGDLDISNKPILNKLEQAVGMKLPGINRTQIANTSLFQKLKNWISFSPDYNFEEIRWKKYIDVILAYNLTDTINPADIKSKYDVYIVLMRLIVDKIGVDYFEIGIEKSFADDLGVD